jgi:hypothetical protein
MNEEYMFIILSTIDTEHSVYSREQRYNQTLETIASIKQHAPGAKIVFVDNSVKPLQLDEKTNIKNNIDLWIDYSNNLFTSYVSTTGHRKDSAFKGINELLLMEHVLPIVKASGLINRRVFKISGRYRLMPAFNLVEYSIPLVDGKYVFKVTEWQYHNVDGVEIKQWFDTRLWSFCGSLYQHYIELMPVIFEYMLEHKSNLELSHTHCVPPVLVLLKNSLFVEGNMARGDHTIA